MATFIDESGDIGTIEGASKSFRLAAVWFEHEETVDKYLDAARELRARLKVGESFEFHFSGISDRMKQAFFEVVSPLPFNFVAASLEKSNFHAGRLTKEFIRERTVATLVDQLLAWYYLAEGCKDWPDGLNERIVYDECEDRKYSQLLKSKLDLPDSGRRRRGKLIRSVKPGKSKADPRLQLVDMVCGAVGRHLSGDSTHYKLISGKVIAIELVTESEEGRSAFRTDRP